MANPFSYLSARPFDSVCGSASLMLNLKELHSQASTPYLTIRLRFPRRFSSAYPAADCVSAAMASIVAASTVVAPAAFAAASSSVAASESSSVKAFSGLKSATLFSAKTQTLSSVQNGSRVQCMQVWNPIDNLKFETLSYLPPLSEQDIAKQVDFMIQQKLIPCLEFDPVGTVSRTNNRSPGYYDGRYWTMWKLPMFGCQDASQVLREVQECKKSYPQCYVRVLGFDNIKQVQIMGFLVAKPDSA